MKILVSGASGLIGTHLTAALESAGHNVVRLVRRATGTHEEMLWDARTAPAVSGFDAVIHLAGESIMGRWTPEKKERILESRMVGTGSLAAGLGGAAVRPRLFLVASAVGYYGPHGDEILTEASPPGNDFLAQVAKAWEEAVEPARLAGIRVVHLRIGVVLTTAGGALKQMLLPFRMGVGGRIGSGEQWISWIALPDVVGAMMFLVEHDLLAGAVNLVAPNPVTNADFTRALGRALHRPTLFPLPAAVVRLVLGEMGEALMLGGQRVVPEKLLAAGYRFQHKEIAEVLHAMLG